MGDLYAAEQLVGDALHAYFVYLERAWEKEHGSASFSDVLRRVEELAPRRAEYAIRLSEFLVRDDQPAQAASVLMRAAEAAQTVGAAELAQELRERARRVDPAAAGPASPEAWDLPEPEPVAAAPLTPVTDAEVEPLRFGEVDLDGAATARGADKVPVDRVVLPSDHPLIDRFLDEGRAEDALALCEQIAAEPGVSSEESAWLAQARGRALALLGRHAEAIREMRFALQDAGTGPEAAAWTRALAGELEKVGELDEARALLREAIESDPGDAAAIERLAALEDRAA
jgi:tetratricopeptide (TPR) repeat protein